ncbi:hypothetical protein QTP86_007603 [Hemibagrus guttatus]|nr:hypothetical protein QTP86_007603 [Hemibagrus guttatus]
MEKYRDGQRELHCVFVDLEKAYDRVPREELWYCMRKSGVAEKYVRVVQDMYERSRTVVRCAVGQTEEFKVEVGLHQGSALSPFLFAIVMDQLSEEVRQESPWTMMFADDIVICSESREQVEENLERWRFALERRGMKVSRSKTEYMCVNEREGSGTVRLQGEDVKKVQEFKYLGSTVQSNGECRKEVKKRVQAGRGEMTEVQPVLDFASSGRSGRRNALPDILGSPAGVNPSDLPLKLTELSLTGLGQVRRICPRSLGFPAVGPNVKAASPSGNRTPVFRVTGGDTVHYTNEEHLAEALKAADTKLGPDVRWAVARSSQERPYTKETPFKEQAEPAPFLKGLGSRPCRPGPGSADGPGGVQSPSSEEACLPAESSEGKEDICQP